MITTEFAQACSLFFISEVYRAKWADKWERGCWTGVSGVLLMGFLLDKKGREKGCTYSEDRIPPICTLTIKTLFCQCYSYLTSNSRCKSHQHSNCLKESKTDKAVAYKKSCSSTTLGLSPLIHVVTLLKTRARGFCMCNADNWYLHHTIIMALYSTFGWLVIIISG